MKLDHYYIKRQRVHKTQESPANCITHFIHVRELAQINDDCVRFCGGIIIREDNNPEYDIFFVGTIETPEKGWLEITQFQYQRELEKLLQDKVKP